MQGRMLEEVVGLLTSDKPFEPDGYLEWEPKNHLDACQATPPMYEAFFQAMLHVVKEGAGESWSDRQTTAWQVRVDCIMARVHGYA